MNTAYKTQQYGDLSVTFIGHASVYLKYQGLTVVTDPYSETADYKFLPKADAILITHDHHDHYDPDAIREIITPQTTLIVPPDVAALLPLDGFSDQPILQLSNGEASDFHNIHIEAVAAYNIRHERAPGEPFHKKGHENGYILTCGAQRVYIAGDTEETPEMDAIHNIDIAFLPLMLPYTMSTDEFISAAKHVAPHYLYPYHFDRFDPAALRAALPSAIRLEVQ